MVKKVIKKFINFFKHSEFLSNRLQVAYFLNKQTLEWLKILVLIPELRSECQP